jgi:hypothetical protein
MVPLPMGVRHELIEGAEQATLPEEDEVVQTLLADRADEPFHVGVGIRGGLIAVGHPAHAHSFASPSTAAREGITRRTPWRGGGCAQRSRSQSHLPTPTTPRRIVQISPRRLLIGTGLHRIMPAIS